MKAQWTSASILFSLLMGLPLTSCAPIQSLLSGVDPNAMQDESGQMGITLPEGWSSDLQLHDNADIQASNVEEDLYVIVLADARDGESDNSVEEVSEFYRSELLQDLETVEAPSRMDVTSINGSDAAQYEIQAAIEDANITYLHTTVMTDTNYYQVVAWTGTDQYATHRSELEKIVKSFRQR